MRFTYKSEADAKKELLLEPGVYDFEVVEAKESISKKGNEMIVAKLRIFSQHGERLLTDYLMEAMRFKLIHFARCVGLEARYEAGELTAAEIVGRAGKVELKIEESATYPPKNVVDDYICEKPAGTNSVAHITKGVQPDEPPF